jgi:hypothetical protein
VITTRPDGCEQHADDVLAVEIGGLAAAVARAGRDDRHESARQAQVLPVSRQLAHRQNRPRTAVSPQHNLQAQMMVMCMVSGTAGTGEDGSSLGVAADDARSCGLPLCTCRREPMYSQARRQEAGHSAAAPWASSASTRAHRTLSSTVAACVMTRCTAAAWRSDMHT